MILRTLLGAADLVATLVDKIAEIRDTRHELARVRAERDAAQSRAARAEVALEAQRLVELERRKPS